MLGTQRNVECAAAEARLGVAAVKHQASCALGDAPHHEALLVQQARRAAQRAITVNEIRRHLVACVGHPVGEHAVGTLHLQRHLMQVEQRNVVHHHHARKAVQVVEHVGAVAVVSDVVEDLGLAVRLASQEDRLVDHLEAPFREQLRSG
jgi:hypothetical protein